MQPELRTDRLLLRALLREDAPALVSLAGDRRIADTTATIPHPYHEQDARHIIQAASQGYATGSFYAYAITQESFVLGVLSLKRMPQEPGTAELGYWVGVPHWGKGYVTEAAQALLDFAFDTVHLSCVKAKLCVRNPASGRVLKKLGLTYIGTTEKASQKWGVWENEEVWSICRQSFIQQSRKQTPKFVAELTDQHVS